MAEILDSGHVVTDEDVDTARLIMELDRALGRPTDSLTQRVAETPAARVRTVLTTRRPVRQDPARMAITCRRPMIWRAR